MKRKVQFLRHRFTIDPPIPAKRNNIVVPWTLRYVRNHGAVKWWGKSLASTSSSVELEDEMANRAAPAITQTTPQTSVRCTASPCQKCATNIFATNVLPPPTEATTAWSAIPNAAKSPMDLCWSYSCGMSVNVERVMCDSNSTRKRNRLRCYGTEKPEPPQRSHHVRFSLWLWKFLLIQMCLLLCVGTKIT